MKRVLLFPALFIFFLSPLLAQTPQVASGIEVLRERGFDLLRGKRVGLITNPTGVDGKLKSTVDILSESKEFTLVSLFGPEHGVRGDFTAGAHVESYTDPQTGLPVYSLYGKTRKPAPEMLSGIDVLVYDIQDIGCRSYTYISTMGLAMEAAAEQNIEFVVLDRPNPLGGLKIEGNVAEDGYTSFVSAFAIPYVYGVTCGELATMLNEDGMLGGGKKCKLTVVSMKGWERKMSFAETGLPWVPTSPHVPEQTSPQYYACSGILGELGVISEGVGYTFPFHTFAAEWIDPFALAKGMNSLAVDGVLFRPMVFKPYYGKWTGKELKGVQIHITDYAKVNLTSLQFLFMQVHHELYPDKSPFSLADPSRLRTFDKVVGTDKIRTLFTKRMSYDDMKEYWGKDVEEFRKKTEKYHLYR